MAKRSRKIKYLKAVHYYPKRGVKCRKAVKGKRYKCKRYTPKSFHGPFPKHRRRGFGFGIIGHNSN